MFHASACKHRRTLRAKYPRLAYLSVRTARLVLARRKEGVRTSTYIRDCQGRSAIISTSTTMESSNKLVWCLLLLVPLVYSLPIDDKAADDYLPRTIQQDEESVPETAPTMPPPPSQELNPPPMEYTSNIKPVEFQYFVPLDAAAAGETQAFHTYEVVADDQKTNAGEEQVRTQFENDYVDDNGEGNAPNEKPNTDAAYPDSYLPDYEALLKQYFGPKSKYFHDKDSVGIAGKANRFKRAAGDSSSSSYAYSQSSANAGSPNNQFSNTGFGHYDSGFGQSGFDNGAFRNGFGGGAADLATGFGYDAGYQNQGGFGGSTGGGNFGNGGYQSASTSYSNDGGIGGGISARIGGDYSNEGASVNGGPSSRGVFSESASSIDSNGKATHYVNAGRL